MFLISTVKRFLWFFFFYIPFAVLADFAKEYKESLTHWAFQPIRNAPIPESRLHNPIDAFVEENLQAHSLDFANPANRQTIIRRLYHDLIGLKPSYEEIKKFVDDTNPKAYAKLVDQLLASPRFGERWGRHWLDIARYADTKGYLAGGESRAYPYAYTYRDWVIKAFNKDLPYDKFIRTQMAADFLTEQPNHPDLAALGFLTVGPVFLNRRQLIIDDQIDLVTRGLMGFTVACARCHDHFHDPIPTADYYSLYGIFDASNKPAKFPLIGKPDENSTSYMEFKNKLNELQQNVDQYLQSKLDSVQSKEGIEQYIKLSLDAYDTPKNDFEALAGKRKLYPKLANRWRDYLKGKEKAEQSFLKPLLNLAKSTSQAETYKKWKSSDLASFPSFLRKRVKENESAELTDFISWYADALHRALIESRTAKEKKGLVFAVSAKGFPANIKPEGIEKYFTQKDLTHKNNLRKKVASHEATHPGAPPRAMSLMDKEKIQEPYVFLRGTLGARGDRVPRRFPVALSPIGVDRKNYTKGSGRLELSESILDPSNPLTSRVMVNRIWKHLFGKGIVRTPSDFGLMGKSPTHPEILDHLAQSFMVNDWSIKKMIRSIVLSKTYRQKTRKLPAKDPDNLYLSSMNRKRLNFEAMRDGMLQVSGELDFTMHGPSQKLHSKPYSKRRAVYGYIDRQNISPTLNSFDFANPNIHAPQRVETTVPQQALFAFNHPFVIERSATLAKKAFDSKTTSPSSQVEFLYRQILSRDPRQDESKLSVEFIGTDAKLANFEDLAQTLLVSNEFFFTD
ncbi:DUF1549 and DUF1553 domain-containing protein [Opitutales bacterium]|nr:DUF1549 and DUF1553 domain-containing protein [Opitutales bacterium]